MGSMVVKHRKVGENRQTKRLYLDFAELCDFGFTPKSGYSRSVKGSSLILKIETNGRYTVSSKKSRGQLVSVIDIANKSIDDLFSSYESVEIIFQENKLIIQPSLLEKRINERENRLRKKLRCGDPLSIASVYTGAGIFDAGLHEGLSLAGQRAESVLAIEREERYLSIARRSQKHWAENARFIEASTESVFTPHLGEEKVDIGILSIPCTGASKAGMAKNGLQKAEDHDQAGAQVFYALQNIDRFNASIYIIENVPEYTNTASYTILKSVLISLGYQLQLRYLSGADFGALEDRKRMILIATTRGLAKAGLVNLNNIVPRRTKPTTVSAILDTSITHKDDAYSTRPHLVDKQDRDIKAGKGFRLQWIIPEEATTLGTMGAGYGKARGTEPFIIHPNDYDKYRSGDLANTRVRLLSDREHAAAKTIPVELIDRETSQTVKHEMLGQSGIYEWFVSIGMHLGSIFTGQNPDSATGGR
jgi:DNA (cytosine-5)-methyltransferase 1